MPRLSPLTPIFDPDKKKGSINTGNMVPIGGSGLLYNAMKDISPLSVWSFQNHEGTLLDEGSEENNMSWTGTVTTTLTGPDGNTYPQMAASIYATTESESYDTFGTGGQTWVTAIRGSNANTALMQKFVNGGTSDTDLELRINPTAFIAAHAHPAAAGTGKFSNADVELPSATTDWSLIEVFFPGDQTAPLIWWNGYECYNDLLDIATLTDLGAAKIRVGGTSATFYVGPTCVVDGTLTTAQRDSIIAAARTEGWIPNDFTYTEELTDDFAYSDGPVSTVADPPWSPSNSNAQIIIDSGRMTRYTTDNNYSVRHETALSGDDIYVQIDDFANSDSFIAFATDNNDSSTVGTNYGRIGWDADDTQVNVYKESTLLWAETNPTTFRPTYTYTGTHKVVFIGGDVYYFNDDKLLCFLPNTGIVTGASNRYVRIYQDGHGVAFKASLDTFRAGTVTR